MVLIRPLVSRVELGSNTADMSWFAWSMECQYAELCLFTIVISITTIIMLNCRLQRIYKQTGGTILSWHLQSKPPPSSSFSSSSSYSSAKPLLSFSSLIQKRPKSDHHSNALESLKPLNHNCFVTYFSNWQLAKMWKCDHTNQTIPFSSAAPWELYMLCGTEEFQEKHLHPCWCWHRSWHWGALGP